MVHNSEIADRLITKDPDVTRLLDRMEKRGWISRRRSDEDRRVVRAFLAPMGRELVDQLDAPVSQFTKARFSSVPAKNLRDLVATLETVRDTR